MNLTIEKMIYGGDGLARNPGGKTVFLPMVLPGEEVSVAIVEEKTSYLRAKVQELLKVSGRRIEPACPYFAQCGGCHYQHADYASQLEFKESILRETFQRTAKLDWKSEIVVHSAEPWDYRNRTRFKVRHAPEFALGYHRMASHDLLPVERCSISSPAINRALAHLWQMGKEQRIPQGIREIEIFASHDDSSLLLEIYVDDRASSLQELAAEMQSGMPEIRGVAFFLSPAGQGSAESKGLESKNFESKNFGENSLSYQVGELSFRVSAGSFFQTNRFLAHDLAQTVAGGESGGTALDLYAGVGLFARKLAQRFSRVVAVESSPASAADLKANLPENAKAVRSTTEEFLAKSQNLHPDLVVVDPPRAGLGEKTTKLLAAMAAPRINYLSCDPTTLARDLNALLKSGYRVKEVHLIDLFPQTFHIESMVRLGR
ncbi:MAG: 23S rRNA (uracil(1939)-C(5))-methyltransferase RlmD [Acidobacteriia bacterium]|nr:23S rRNA (uracil(1939)-C(5))-methyltransferase RlmD [Terriglobia bacterium]